MKRILFVSLGIGAIAAAGLAYVWFDAGKTGGTNIEAWIGSQIVRVVENYINPKITFETLDYQAPRTVVVTKFALDQNDTTIARFDELQLELAEIPRPGQPIKIARIEAKRPHLFFRAKDGGFVGWSGFVKSESFENPETVPAGQRFSDVMVLRYVEIVDGELVYEEQRDGKRMTLPGLNFTLETPPVEGEPGLYELNADLQRDDLLDIKVSAQLNLDLLKLKIDELTASVTLDENGRAALPPALQQFLEQHQAKGVLTAKVSGDIPLNALQESTADVQLEMRDARAAIGDVLIPIGHVTVKGNMPNGAVDVEVSDAAMRFGDESICAFDRFAMTLASLPLDGAMLTISSMRLDKPRVAFFRADDGGWRGWDDVLNATSKYDDASSSTVASGEGDPSAQAIDKWRVTIQDAKVTDAKVVLQTSVDAEPIIVDGIAASFSSAPTSANDTLSTGPNAEQNVQLQVTRAPMFDASFSGRVPLRDWQELAGDGAIDLRQTTLPMGDKVLPVESFHASTQIENGTARFAWNGNALSGELSGNGSAQLAQPHTFDATWNIVDVQLEDTLHALEEKSEPIPETTNLLNTQPQSLAGKLSTEGQAQGEIASLPQSLSGAGTLTIREGRLVNLPIMAQIAQVLSVSPLSGAVKPTDTADVAFELTGDGIKIVKAEVVSRIAVVRGDGMIGYDGSLDLLVNAGALEKLQDELGAVGDLLSAVSDRMVKYTIKGKVGEPKIGVSAFGAGS